MTTLALSSLFLFISSIAYAQPTDLPWNTDPDCESIITTGIVAVSCGVLEQNPATENFTFGMINLNGALPAAGRIDVTAAQEMYHHPSWQVDSIGNVFGITIDKCGNTYTTTSAQYSSAYLFQQGVIRYGEIGGGSEDLSAAGTIYKMDAITGQASVFSVLPQQSYSFTHQPCEGGTPINRNTGPGLGNIVFSFTHNVFYVTNFEDGRIYRLDLDGNILDSYDSGVYDDGQSGTPTFTDLAYGVDISNDDSQLFFGTMGDNIAGTMAEILAIDLQPDGSFVGSIDNTNLPVGATWDNYVGTEILHFTVPNAPFISMSFISDLEFTPNGNLLVGNRVGCGANIHTSYNHEGRSWIIEPDGSGFFNQATIIYTSNGFISDNNSYGGVSVFENPNGTTEYVISSADMLSENGPHGICTQEEGNYGLPFDPAEPAGIIAYVPGGVPFDPKGIGGDVHVFKECDCSVTCPEDIEADDLMVCSGDLFDLTYTLIMGDSNLDVTWSDEQGTIINPDDVTLSNSDCVPDQVSFYLTAVCLEDTTLTYSDTAIVTVITTDISPFVTLIEEDCNIDVIIDPNCLDYLQIDGTIPTINPGDSGTVSIDIIQTTPISCDVYTVELSYDCTCNMSNIVATTSECLEDAQFEVQVNLEITNSASNTFTIFDENGNPVGTYNYSDLPITLGPFPGDSTTVWNYTAVDDIDPTCNGLFNFGPVGCPVCGDCEIPNAFTPDADGVNDEFTVICFGFANVTEFQIYNRWGQKVHDAIEPWRGMHKGKPAPSDVYIYRIVVDTSCELKEYSGDVTLIR